MLALPGLPKLKKEKTMSKKSKKKIFPDNYHYHESIDRIYIIGKMLEDFVLEHPVCMRHKKVRKKIERALQELAESYQMVGSIDARNDLENQ